jgi:hypothetical protein
MANIYRFLKAGNPEAFRLDPTGTNPISLGDLVIWSAADFFLKRLTAGNGPQFIGVAEGVGPTPASSIDNAANLVENIRVRGEGVFRFKGTAADSLSHGDALVIGADAQTVLKRTAEAATEIIGYVWRPTASAAFVVAAGNEVDVLIAANHPAVGINF